jgi:hypothetical protein
MEIEVPRGTRLMRDVSFATWVEEALSDWPAGDGFPVRGIVPPGFERYVRVFHPARPPVGDRSGRVRWAEVAAARGKAFHPRMQWPSIVGGWGPGDVPEWDHIVPYEELPEEVAAVLIGLLSPFTETPDECWFALWDGYGSLGPSSSITVEVDQLGHRRIVEDTREEAEKFRFELDKIPRVRTLRVDPSGLPAREYLLFRGPLRALADFRFRDWWQPPNIWWPHDRAWCVATEVDGYDTFVGGSTACVDAVLTSPDLEALPVELDDGVDFHGDDLNGVPPHP